MSALEYLEEIPWFQDLPEDAADLARAQRLALRQNQVVMTRHGLPAWAFLVRGSVLWQAFEPSLGKVRTLGEVRPGQFIAPERWRPGAIAVTPTGGEILLLPCRPDQATPPARCLPHVARLRTPANDLPFHAFHFDLLGPFREAADIGSGVGHFAELMAGYSDRVTAVDPVPEFGALGRDRMAALGYQDFEFRRAVAEQLPFDDGALDLVGSRLAVHQFRDPAAFAREVHRVLRIGGHLALTDLVAPADPEAMALLDLIERTRDPTHAGVMTAPGLQALFSAGFEVVDRFDTVHKIALNPWLRQAGVADCTLAALHARLATASTATREALGLAGLPAPDKRCFDSPRLSLLLRRTS
jgi:ubiquinone/menaquinone biosynthesis C-methylase UbiE